MWKRSGKSVPDPRASQDQRSPCHFAELSAWPSPAPPDEPVIAAVTASHAEHLGNVSLKSLGRALVRARTSCSRLRRSASSANSRARSIYEEAAVATAPWASASAPSTVWASQSLALSQLRSRQAERIASANSLSSGSPAANSASLQLHRQSPRCQQSHHPHRQCRRRYQHRPER